MKESHSNAGNGVQEVSPSRLNRVGRAITRVTRSVGTRIVRLFEEPIPYELSTILTQEMVRDVMEEYYKDRRTDYNTPITLKAGERIFTCDKDIRMNTLGDMGRQMQTIFSILEIRYQIRLDELSVKQQTALRMFVMEKLKLLQGA